MSYRSDALERLAQQYQDSPRLKALLGILVDEADKIAAAFEQLRLRLDIDQSVGVQLDLIGEIVGKARPRTDPAEDEAFAFATGPGLGFGSTTDPTIGGYFGSLSDIFTERIPLNDEGYRKYLRAAIYAAQAICTVEDIYKFVEFVFVGETVIVTDGVGVVTIEFDRTLRSMELELLNELTPVPAGIRLQINEPV